MSLKGGIVINSKATKELLDAIEDYQNGKKNSEKRLYKCVEKRIISAEAYDNLIKKYADMHTINKNKNKTNVPQKITEILCSVAAVVVLFGSMLSTLGIVTTQNGKGAAVWYFFIWLWAFYYAVSKDSKTEKIRKLEQEIRRLENSLKGKTEYIEFIEAESEKKQGNL